MYLCITNLMKLAEFLGSNNGTERLAGGTTPRQYSIDETCGAKKDLLKTSN